MVINETTPNSETSTTEDNKEVKTKTDEQPPKEENKKEETKTETKAEENKEQPKKEIKKEEKVETYKDAIDKVTAKYEKKLATQRADFEKKIKERDDVIAEMVVNEENGREQTPTTSIKDRIAKRRAYKKW